MVIVRVWHAKDPMEFYPDPLGSDLIRLLECSEILET